ncbi:MAG: hypothetical protein A2725_04335 [Candidatus Magasanikbacteria bacterium RIFCSPHIGHO2_01_FULL_33_34]|uniref:FAD-binding FR-type domain-containing protein n=1 Tax=Candidatus Magasanikbacteria bacterium RIFCSPHIGHO2_01_FULL_33_34 TaxID=1798671 RepID=A0A1F6LI40_9BACT|nr:MAG: hypothetical protein A2725_04335 [Candidatus Magasanikbacteria bacterium RIFCSPHIGHO2_01_FULL_33_34]OGH65192.1 MAG: hypothetical protein A3B83_04095 [Candidatus Magasanikbacteria bacterium RIFCSPHIGHO2_02_FULL_33_17]OGH75263.1 MAG: hypothetical protein A3A89_04070 [Candidatus Magasanikbacteria bacterium RIFCSPLOWO2_01_FULL_33_34]OGH82185.1 MAG: hypothetical protein A3F93_00465 [Candidatus Magasanikbacteria bacterium RIFCSPLOWO2_12_FULL_34_7]
MSTQYKVKLLEKRLITDDVISLVVEKPSNFDYKAGQFSQIMIPNPENSEKFLKRSYSICSTPEENNIEFCIKLLPEGVGSNYLRQVKVGDEIDLVGPFGKFVLKEEKPLVLVATGVGMAPIFGLIKDSLINKNYKEKIHLLFGLRHDKDIFFTNELDKLKEKFDNFDYTLTLSQPSEEWSGNKGRVTDYIQKHINNTAHYYICGNIKMITEIKQILSDLSIEKENIHFEAF